MCRSATARIIQPSCASLGGLVLARLLLNEPLPLRRVAGAVVIVLGLAVIGAEALRTMGASGVIGDLLFVAAGSSFAVFGMLLRLWRIAPMPAAAVTSVLSLVGLPMLFWTYDNMIAAGFLENLLQAVVQGVFAGAGAIYLFTRAVVLLGAGRAVVFPSLVPPFTLLIGFLALGEVPSVSQLIGLADRHGRLPADAAQLVLRPGIFAGGVREHRFDDLEARNVDGRVHVQEDRGVAENLLDAEIEHDAVAAVQLERMLRHFEDFLRGKHFRHVAQRVGVRRILVDRSRGARRAARAPLRSGSPYRRAAAPPPDA